MNLISPWFLTPRFQLELKPEELFTKEKNNEENIVIQMMLEGEIDLTSSDFLFAIQLFGELKTNIFYPLNNSGKKILYIVSGLAPKKMAFQKPGKAHMASHVGAVFSAQLLTTIKTNNKISAARYIVIDISESVKNTLEKEEYEFLLGIAQRSMTNKIKRKDLNSKTNVKNIIFSESTFTKEHFHKFISISNAMCLTRSLINMPPNELNPESFENILISLLKNNGDEVISNNNISIEIMNYEKLKQEGCNLICAVGQGSQYKPKIIKLNYSAKAITGKLKNIIFIGKGITFDSGGYDIKASSGMRNMKKDMGGAAAALGSFFACAALNLPVNLSCYLAVAENMVSGNAMRPGDIYKARNGLHVEIENTDSEGRLVLADAISLACDTKPDWLVDFATLTGAARVSLGPMVDSLYGNHPGTQELLYSTSVENGDWVWPMPLLADYENYLESTVADCLNSSSSSYAGSVTAALFLQKFVSVEKWNHIDTFMWCDKPNSLWHEGSSPTAKCVRLMTRALEKFISSEENS